MIPEENMLRIASGACFKTSGINSTPSPKERLTANTNVSLRPISWDEIIRIPAAATVPNISKVAPPNTGSGIKENTAPTMGNNPKRTSIAAI